jgi:hypothetical protein
MATLMAILMIILMISMQNIRNRATIPQAAVMQSRFDARFDIATQIDPFYTTDDLDGLSMKAVCSIRDSILMLTILNFFHVSDKSLFMNLIGVSLRQRKKARSHTIPAYRPSLTTQMYRRPSFTKHS